MTVEGWFFLIACPLTLLSFVAWWARNESRWLTEEKAKERARRHG